MSRLDSSKPSSSVDHPLAAPCPDQGSKNELGSMSMSSTARSDPIVAVVCFQGTPPIGSRGTSLPLGRWMRVLDECRCFAEGHLGRGCDVQRGTRAGCGTDSSQKWTASLVIRQLMSEQETPISLLLNSYSPAGRISQKREPPSGESVSSALRTGRLQSRYPVVECGQLG